MNRVNAVAHAMEHQGARGFTALLSKAYSIPAEPTYSLCCSYCGDEVEEGRQCCSEIHQEMTPHCPVCDDNVEWKSGTTGCGIEARTPYCVNPKCNWEGEPQ